jgi:hypothetical protein
VKKIRRFTACRFESGPRDHYCFSQNPHEAPQSLLDQGFQADSVCCSKTTKEHVFTQFSGCHSPKFTHKIPTEANGRGRAMASIYKNGDSWRVQIAKEGIRRLETVSAATVLREINLLSHCFTTARKEWKWIAESPLTGMRRPKGPKSRDRLIAPREREALHMYLGYKEGGTPQNMMGASAQCSTLR